jgi:hypothetical protein
MCLGRRDKEDMEILERKPPEKRQLGGRSEDWRITLKWSVRRQDVRVEHG